MKKKIVKKGRVFYLRKNSCLAVITKNKELYTWYINFNNNITLPIGKKFIVITYVLNNMIDAKSAVLCDLVFYLKSKKITSR